MKTHALARALGLAELTPEVTRLFDLVTPSFGGLELGPMPRWASTLTDDGTPFELALAFTATGPSLRVLAETRRAPFELDDAWRAGIELSRALGALPGVDITRFERVAARFAPGGSSASFALMHAGTLGPDGELAFEVLLNPRASGTVRAPQLVRETLAALGADYAWQELAPKLHATSELIGVSLELSARPNAKVGVHVAHPRVRAAEIDALVRDESGYTPGLARRWVETLSGFDGPFDARPLVTCHAFRSPHDAAEVTVEVPVGAYTVNDAEALLRVSELVGERAPVLRNAVEATAQRPLEMGRGLVRSVALRPDAYGTRVSVCLAPEAHAISSPRRPHVSELFRRTHGVVTRAL
jgi:hypothetical protein